MDLLVSAAGIAAVACHLATTTIPIVSVNVPDPVGRKLVASLNRPGGNLTGLSNMAVELTRKRIELAKEMIKDLSRVALLETRQMKSVRARILRKLKIDLSRPPTWSNKRVRLDRPTVVFVTSLEALHCGRAFVQRHADHGSGTANF